MAKCPVCNAKIARWKLIRLTDYNPQFRIRCGCGAELKAKYWLLWNIVIVGLIIGGLYLGGWLASAFNIPKVLVVIIWFGIVFFSSPILVYFGTFIKR